MQGIGANQEYGIEKTPLVGSCDDSEGAKCAQESTERVHRRERTSWKAQREMVRCSGQGFYEDVEM